MWLATACVLNLNKTLDTSQTGAQKEIIELRGHLLLSEASAVARVGYSPLRHGIAELPLKDVGRKVEIASHQPSSR
jgi:hypothetical protein